MDDLLAKYGTPSASAASNQHQQTIDPFDQSLIIQDEKFGHQRHTMHTIFSPPRSGADIKVQISSLHLPKRAAVLYCAVIFNYTAKFLSERNNMIFSLLKIQCQHRINTAHRATAARVIERQKENELELENFENEKVSSFVSVSVLSN